MVVTEHAINQYILRVGGLVGSDPQDVTNKILKIVSGGREIFLKPEWRAAELICHNFNEAKYMYRSGVVAVIVDDNAVTIHKNDKRRLVV